MPKIVRITLLKIDDAEAIQQGIQKYSTLIQDAKKDGKPYILTASASACHEDARSQGYTLASRTIFESKEDMDYFDNECESHVAIKAIIKPKLAGPPLIVYMDA